MEDQYDHCNNQEYVDQPAADAGKQAEKPEYSDNDGYPEQHESLLSLSADEIGRPAGIDRRPTDGSPRNTKRTVKFHHQIQ